MALTLGGRRGLGLTRLLVPAAVTVVCVLVPALAQAASTCTGACHMNYYGGPVMSPVRTVLVVWGTHVNADYQSTDGALLADVAADSGTVGNVFSMLAEYRTAGATVTGGHASSNQTLAYDQTYGGAHTINPSVCSGTTSCTVSDAQLQAELKAQIGSGALPAPSGDGLETAYIVLFEQHITYTNAGGSSGTNFCGSHGDTTLGSGAKVVYVVVPDDAANPGCGAGTPIQNETSILTHEFMEAITDPLIEEVGTIGFPASWYDPTNGEIGDPCVYEATNTINGHTYTVQKEWSNRHADCVAGSDYVQPTGDFTSSASAEPVSFSASAQSANGDKSIVSYSWDFGDGSTSSGTTPTHSYAAGGTYHVTMTATDSLGFIARATHDVVAPAPPPPPAPPSPPAGNTPQPAPVAATSPGSVTSFGPAATANAGKTVVVTPGIVAACSASVPCTATLTATAKVPASLLARVKLKKVVVGTGRFTLQPGTRHKLTFKLTKQGAKLLRKLHRMKVAVRVSLSYPGAAAPLVLTRVVTIRQPRRRR